MIMVPLDMDSLKIVSIRTQCYIVCYTKRSMITASPCKRKFAATDLKIFILKPSDYHQMYQTGQKSHLEWHNDGCDMSLMRLIHPESSHLT